MSTRSERIEVFEDTIKWIQKDGNLSASIDKTKKETEVFYEDDYPEFDASLVKDTEIVVSGKRSYEAAIDLYKKNRAGRLQ